MEDYVEVIRHDGVCGNVYAEDLSLVENELFNPASAVLKAPTLVVIPTEKCSSYTA
jgi:hypothetical protein